MKTVAVDTTAGGILLAAAGHRDFLHVQNTDAAINIFVKYDGDSDALTSANGMRLAPGDWLVLNNDGVRKIFDKEVRAIAASGSVDVRVAGVE